MTPLYLYGNPYNVSTPAPAHSTRLQRTAAVAIASQITAAQQSSEPRQRTMASSTELVQQSHDNADGENFGGIGGDKRPSGPSDAGVLVVVVGGTRPGHLTPAVVNDGYVKSSHLVCVLYKEFGWHRHSSKEKARCPSCTATATCKGWKTSNLWPPFKTRSFCSGNKKQAALAILPPATCVLSRCMLRLFSC